MRPCLQRFSVIVVFRRRDRSRVARTTSRSSESKSGSLSGGTGTGSKSPCAGLLCVRDFWKKRVRLARRRPKRRLASQKQKLLVTTVTFPGGVNLHHPFHAHARLPSRDTTRRGEGSPLVGAQPFSRGERVESVLVPCARPDRQRKAALIGKARPKSRQLEASLPGRRPRCTTSCAVARRFRHRNPRHHNHPLPPSPQ